MAKKSMGDAAWVVVASSLMALITSIFLEGLPKLLLASEALF